MNKQIEWKAQEILCKRIDGAFQFQKYFSNISITIIIRIHVSYDPWTEQFVYHDNQATRQVCKPCKCNEGSILALNLKKLRVNKIKQDIITTDSEQNTSKWHNTS